MIRTETVEASRLARACDIGHRLDTLMGPDWQCNLGVSFYGDGIGAIVGMNFDLVRKLAKAFPGKTDLKVGITNDGDTVIQAIGGTSVYLLYKRAPLNGRDYMFRVVSFARLLELAKENGSPTQLAHKLARELCWQLDSPEKKAKPSKVENLRAKVAAAAKEVADLEARLYNAERYASMDRSPLERADRLYMQRVEPLLRMARLMGWVDNGRSLRRKDEKDRDAANREAVLRILSGLRPPLPRRLADGALAVFDIPVAHWRQRLAAAGTWFVEARAWVARSMGGEFFACPFDARERYLVGSFRRLNVGYFCPDRSTRLWRLSYAQTLAEKLQDLRDRLTEARYNLTNLQAMLELEVQCEKQKVLLELSVR